MSIERIVATYRIETPLAIDHAAAVLAGEQSSGTFVEIPGESRDLKERFLAKVESIRQLSDVAAPSLPGVRVKGKPATGPFHQAELDISWSIENMGYNLPTLVSTVAGNLFELSQFSGLKLLDIHVPESFATRFRGAAFGVTGTRKLVSAFDRPLIGTIIKPSVGMTPQQTADIVKVLCEAGIDFIKDDELMADPPHSPFDQRIGAVLKVINDHAQKTGKKVMYAANITDEYDAMMRHYDFVVEHGGIGAMMSLNSVGIIAAKKVCDRGQLSIHGHRNGWGGINRHPMIGWEFPAYQTIWRLAGVDQLHVNGIANKFWEPDDMVVQSIESCRRKMFPRVAPDRFGMIPVVSSGQTGLQAPETFRRTQTVDLLYMAGGGIMAHPLGAGAGVKALQQAWEAAVRGIDLNEFAKTHVELKHQIEKFGNA